MQVVRTLTKDEVAQHHEMLANLKAASSNLESGVSESAERITSAANLWADMASRGAIDEALRFCTRSCSYNPGWGRQAGRPDFGGLVLGCIEADFYK